MASLGDAKAPSPSALLGTGQSLSCRPVHPVVPSTIQRQSGPAKLCLVTRLWIHRHHLFSCWQTTELRSLSRFRYDPNACPHSETPFPSNYAASFQLLNQELLAGDTMSRIMKGKVPTIRTLEHHKQHVHEIMVSENSGEC